MGFSVKLVPGLRVGVSSRGVRTSVGPRIARVHVGAGGVGVSTGAGPVGYYTSVGGGRRSRVSTGSATRQLATAARPLPDESEAAATEALTTLIVNMLNIHREHFPLATRPIIPMPPPIDSAQIFEKHKLAAKDQTSALNRKNRNAALATAQEEAEREIAAETHRRATERSQAQTAADEVWQALERCDPEITLDQLAAAFADNDAAASAVGINGNEVSVVVVVPSAAGMPSRMPNPSELRARPQEMSKGQIAHLYKLLVCGHMIVTLKETFAVVPALSSAQIVAVRASEPDVYGKTQPEVILAGHCDRNALEGVLWDDVLSHEVFEQCLTSQLILEDGHELQSIPITDEPELSALLDVIDFENLARS